MEDLSLSLNGTNLTSTVIPTYGSLKSQIQNVVLGLCCALGLPGNAIVLVILLRRWVPTNFTHKLMFSLACCDCFSLVMGLVWLDRKAVKRDVNSDSCKVVSSLILLTLYANVLITMLMSVHRYVNVLHRQSWARLGRVGETVLLLGLWGAAGLLTWPSVASWGYWGKGRFVCGRPLHLDGEGLAALLTETLLGFIVPFSVIIACYSCLHKNVKQATMSSNKRMTELISRIIITFLVLWTPMHIVNIVGIVGFVLRPSSPDLSYKLEHFRDTTETVVNALPVFSAVVDPFLYAFTFRNFLPFNRKTNQVDNVTRRTSVTGVISEEGQTVEVQV